MSDANEGAASTAASRGTQANEQSLVGGVDVLADPAAGRAARRRSSRFGTLVVLAITAAIVLGGVWLVNTGKTSDAITQEGSGTSVSMPGRSGVPAPQVGKPAQDFTVTTTDGQKVSLASLRGKAVWLTFGASWCTGCQAEVADIEAAAKAYADRGVVVLDISIGEDNDTVRAYAERINATFPMAGDPTNAVADMYAITSIPSHFFIDSSGVIRQIRLGTLSPSDMSASLDALLTS